MPTFSVRVKQRKVFPNFVLEPGLEVQISQISNANPIQIAPGRKLIQEAFKRVHGLDMEKMNALNMAYLETVKE